MPKRCDWSAGTRVTASVALARRSLVGLRQRAIVHAIDMVAGEHQHAVGTALFDHVPVLRHGVRGAAIPAGMAPGLVGLQDLDAAGAPVEIPGASRADVVVQRGRRVLGDQRDVLDVASGSSC